MNKPTKHVRVFLIHAHDDRDAVHKLNHRLRRDSIGTWLDAANLQPGQDWQSEIRKVILTSDAVIVCLSRAFNKQHGYRHEELKLALEKASLLVDEVFIIPARLEDCDTPESLKHLHRLDLFVMGGYRRLVRALKESEG